jgi:hypothetical protein
MIKVFLRRFFLKKSGRGQGRPTCRWIVYFTLTKAFLPQGRMDNIKKKVTLKETAAIRTEKRIAGSLFVFACWKILDRGMQQTICGHDKLAGICFPLVQPCTKYARRFLLHLTKNPVRNRSTIFVVALTFAEK